MNKNLLVLVVVGVCVLGAYYFLSDRATAPLSPTEETEVIHTEDVHDEENVSNEGSEVHIVRYTSSGFESSAITIATGDSVTFMNNSSEPLRIAFGNHDDHDASPDHSEHPTITEGMSDMVVFPEAGTYEYHNHHADGHHGTVIVN